MKYRNRILAFVLALIVMATTIGYQINTTIRASELETTEEAAEETSAAVSAPAETTASGADIEMQIDAEDGSAVITGAAGSVETEAISTETPAETQTSEMTASDPETEAEQVTNEATELTQDITDEIKVTAKIPAGAFEAEASAIDMKIESLTATELAWIKSLMEKDIEEATQSSASDSDDVTYEVGDYMTYRITFLVNGEVAEPTESIEISFTNTKTDIGDIKAAKVFYYDAHEADTSDDDELAEISQRELLIKAYREVGKSTDDIDDLDLSSITLNKEGEATDITFEAAKNTIYGVYTTIEKEDTEAQTADDADAEDADDQTKADTDAADETEKSDAEATDETKASETEASESETETSETEKNFYTTDIASLTYEDDSVVVDVTEVDEGAIPEGASLSVTPIVNEGDTADQYAEVEQKLQEKAEADNTSIAGFLAYDIKFVDAEGNKLEPNGAVKVTMDYKEAVIADEAVETVENTDDLESTADLDVTVLHLEEDEDGNVTQVADLDDEAVTSGSVETLATDDEQKVETVEFTSESFSRFVITWKDTNYLDNFNVTVHYVDENGNEIEGINTGNLSEKYTKSVTFSELASGTITSGSKIYRYKEARLNSYTGSVVTKADGTRNGKKGSYTYKLTFKNDNSTVDTLSTNGKTTSTVSLAADYDTDTAAYSDDTSRDVYLVYETETAAETSSFVITWKTRYLSDDNFKVTVHYVDTEGNTLNGTQTSNVTMYHTDTAYFANYATSKITGSDGNTYKYKEARLNSYNGSVVTKAVGSNTGWNEWNFDYYLTFKNGDTQVGSQLYSTGHYTQTADVYLVFEKETSGGSGGGSSQGEDASITHEKYINKVGEDTYDLTLNVSSSQGSSTKAKKVDILLILDKSASMGYSMSNQTRIYWLKQSINAMVDAFADKGNDFDVRYSYVSFQSWLVDNQNWMTGSQLKSSISGLTAANSSGDSGGTNYQAGLTAGANKINTDSTSWRDDAERVVVFLTDGVPTFHNNSWGNWEKGGGNYTQNSDYNGAITGAKLFNGNFDRFIPIGIGLSYEKQQTGRVDGNWRQDVKVESPYNMLKYISYAASGQETTSNPTKTGMIIEDPTNVSTGEELKSKFESIVPEVEVYGYKNVSITDTLSQYIATSDDTAFVLKMAKKDSNDNFSLIGTTQTVSLKTLMSSGTKQSDGSYQTTVTMTGSDGKTFDTVLKWTPSTDTTTSNGTVYWGLGESYTLEDDVYYYVTMTSLKTTDTARNYMKDNGTYPGTYGDAYTDAKDANYYAPKNSGTSSNKMGFQTNSSSQVKYTLDKDGETEKTASYPNPAIQVNVSKLQGTVTSSKTAKVSDWDERTYDITLSAAANIKEITQVTETDTVDVVFVFDKSGSMNFRASLNLYATGTTEKLNTSKVYYTVDDSTYHICKDADVYKATMYRVYCENDTWKYVDDSYWDYDTNSISSGYSGKIYNLNNRSTGTMDLNFYTTSDSHNRMYYLKNAATEFTNTLAETAPNSKIGLVTFAAAGTEKIESYLTVMSSDGSALIQEKINNISTEGGTRQDKGLDEALNVLKADANTEGHKRYVILLTDGAPNYGSEKPSDVYADMTASAKAITDTGATLITIGVGMDDSNDSLKTAKEKLSEIASTKAGSTAKYAYTVNDASNLGAVFKEILGETIKEVQTPRQLTGVTVTDYIDNRFELTEDAIKQLQADGATIGTDADGTYIRWTNQTIEYDENLTPKWSKTFQVQAKDSYIGGNNVTTNGSGSGLTYSMDGFTGSQNFPQPTVNVNTNILVGDQKVTIYKGDYVPSDEDIIDQIFGTTETTSYKDGTVGTADKSKVTLTWYKDEACTQPITREEIDATKPDSDTSFYLKVTYDAGQPTEESNANTTKTITNPDGLTETKTYIDGDPVRNNDGTTSYIETAKNKTDPTKDYGTYTIKVIEGEITITKILAENEETKVGETFTFNIYQLDAKVQDTDPDTWTLYKGQDLEAGQVTVIIEKKTVTNDDGTETVSYTGSTTLKNLARGTYMVTEADKTDYSIQSVTKGDATDCFSMAMDEKDAMIFSLGYDMNGQNVIVHDLTNKTYRHDTVDGAGQLGVVIYTNETVISNWGIRKISANKAKDQQGQESELTLQGAEFTLKKTEQNDDGTYTTYYGISGENGWVTWYTDEARTEALSTKMPAGTYTLQETKAPDGYAVSGETWTVVIKKNGSLKGITSSTTGTSIISTKETITQEGTEKEVTIYRFTNTPLYDLPSTGGLGIYWYMIGGMLLMIAASLIYIRNKRGEVPER